MKTELIENIGFTEEEYNARTLGEGVASFDEFINAIVAFVEEVAAVWRMPLIWRTTRIFNYK